MTKISEAIQDLGKSREAEIDAVRLRGGQLHLSQLRKRIQAELEELRKEAPLTRREITSREYQAAQGRASEAGKALRDARQRLNEHIAKFDKDIPLSDVSGWAQENARLQMDVAAYADLWKISEKYVEFCRLQAEQAMQEPDPNRVRILARIDTLKHEFDGMNWNRAQTPRGEEILVELRELQKQLNPVIAD